MTAALKKLADIRLWVAVVLVVFQYWILLHPQQPLFERPVHLLLALFLVYLWFPVKSGRMPRAARLALDVAGVAAVAALAVYLWIAVPRFMTRIDNVDPVFWWDVVFGAVLVVLLIEAVRRTVGWILVWVIAGFLLYGALGYLIPAPAGFRGFGVEEYTEILTMTTSGILGVTTETSVNFVFYFVAFGAAYSAIGGAQLFIDLAVRLVGRSRGGGAKIAIVGSSLMGTISGSAVANVTATGVFSIPLMRRSGMSAHNAAATEAIASTGGQLMPPVMGIAAFVMAELLSVPYAQIALAGLIPAMAFYIALYFNADLYARKTGIGTLDKDAIGELPPLLPRLHLLVPPLVLVAGLCLNFSAQMAATYATLSCFPLAFIRRENWLTFDKTVKMINDLGKQMAEIAIPIAAIGIIIAVAIQSNIALKFAAGVIAASGGALGISLILVIVGCIVMGMGLPTVAAYIIGAVLYVPALKELGVAPLAAHFFVMYYCVLSMVTPPVALASYAAAGLAGAGPMTTSLAAFRMSFVCFLVPFAFVVDPALLFQADLIQVLIASAGLFLSTSVWAIGLIGYFRRPLVWCDRILLMACGVIAIVAPTGAMLWDIGVGVAAVFLLLNWFFPRFSFATLTPDGWNGKGAAAPDTGQR
ncbi:MAG: TRAP transporter fused permease subunit [Alphaproteobacteria bacterium]|nr:TRAP transporter fused permease subunit [Alphaproteobacteria bacterium]